MNLENLKEKVENESCKHDYECRAFKYLGELRDAYIEIIIKILEKGNITEEVIKDVSDNLEYINYNEFVKNRVLILTNK